MKREFIYERRQTAGRMEAIMIVTSGVALCAAVVGLVRYGWLSSLTLLILASIAYALSVVFDLIGDLFASIDKPDEGGPSRHPESTPHQS